MKPVALLSALMLGRFASAQEVQSKPFHLVLESADKSLNGQQLSACHTGAAIESLCLAGASGANFFTNSTAGGQSPLEGYEPSSILVWNLPLGGAPSFVSEPMSFYVDPSTNVALPLFEPGYTTQYISFDKRGQLAIVSFTDDTQKPPSDNKVRALKNWYICQTNFSGYRYKTLTWVLGNGRAKPQNPTCVKVQVRRKFV